MDKEPLRQAMAMTKLLPPAPEMEFNRVSIGGGINIALGTGDDYFKGFGAGTVDGGAGFDTLDLKAFKRSQLIISGVTSGNTLNSANISFNNNGNSISLSTTGFDKFIFADSSFSYSTLGNGA
jgi:hypothetical protein